MKKFKTLFVTCITVFTLLLVSGCGGGSSDKFSTVDEVLDNYEKVSKDVNNFKAAMKMDLKMELEAKEKDQVIKLSLPMDFNMDLSIAGDTNYMNMKMVVDGTEMAALLGQNEEDSKMEMNLETYSVKDGDHYKVYTKEDKKDWKVHESKDDDMDLGVIDVQKDVFKKAKLEKDAKNYIVVAKFKDLMENDEFKDTMKSFTQMQGNSDEILKALGETECKYYFDKESGLLTKMSIDNMKTTVEEQGMKMNITLNLGVDVSDYNKTKVELPANLKNLK